MRSTGRARPARLACLTLLGVLASCAGDPLEPAAVASVVVQPDSVSLTYGQTVQLTASLRDASGNAAANRAVTWSSTNPASASVTATGLVTAVAWGRVVIQAVIDGTAGAAVVLVGEPGPQDFAIADAQFTQGVQAADGSFPMILEGGAAVLNVLLRAKQPTTKSNTVLLRLFDGTGGLVRTDTATAGGVYAGPAGYHSPAAQFLLPASLLQPGLQWQLVRDPKAGDPDDSTANDVFPRAGLAKLATIAVPTFKLRFIPIVLASHGGATGAVAPNLLPEYLQTARSVLPLGRIEVSIGTALTSSASFGSPPSGGDAVFWQQVLGELDLARIADTSEPEAHWYGVVRPPAGFNFTVFGGFAYIPASSQATGPLTRSAVGVQVGWFNRPTQARDLVAHELGHNFGRRHAPCGGPTGLDPDFPGTGGMIGLPGHDVYSWSQGLVSEAIVVPATTGDVMSYCYPMWAGVYSYRGILDFRRPPVVAAASPTQVLIVRGSVEAASGITLEPAFVIRARPTPPASSGSYRLEAVAADGRLLLAHQFDPTALDHAPTVRHFTLAIPVTGTTADQLSTLVVRGPAGAARLSRPDGGRAAPLSAAGIIVSQTPGGPLSVSCPGGASRGILVRDATTGGVLGTAPERSLLIWARAATLRVACSDGIRTVTALATAP